MIRRGLIALSAAAAITACGTVPNPGALLFDIPASCGTDPGVSTNMICAGKDLVTVVGNKPAPRMAFDYAETDAFDLQLSSSLGAGLDKVTLAVPDAVNLPLQEVAAQTQPAADSPRLVFWLAQIRNSGGEIKACDAQLESALAEWLIKMGADYMKQRLTYGPADKYDATVFFNGSVDESPIRRVVFTPRNGNALSCS
jgi:hypothetical protein